MKMGLTYKATITWTDELFLDIKKMDAGVFCAVYKRMALILYSTQSVQRLTF